MSGGKDKGKGKKEERHSTRKGAGTIDKFTYKALGTGGGTKIALRGTTITISSDEEEYEDVASPTMTVEPPSTPIGVPFDSATGKGKRFIFADYEEEEEEDLYVRDVLGGSAVVAPTPAVVAPTPAVVAPTGGCRSYYGGWGRRWLGLLSYYGGYPARYGSYYHRGSSGGCRWWLGG